MSVVFMNHTKLSLNFPSILTLPTAYPVLSVMEEKEILKDGKEQGQYISNSVKDKS